MSDNLSIKGYIYLLKISDTNNRIIYKPGKTINFYKRFKKYYYAEILNFIVSDDITTDENEIIKIFNINCKLDTGREFFIAEDDYFVLKLFMDYFTNKNNKNIELSNSIINSVVTDNVVVDTLIIDNISDSSKNINTEYICPNIYCKKHFDYCSYLRKHLLNSYHCNKSIDNIDLYITEINNLKKNSVRKIIKEYKCSNCNNNYKNKFTLQRHISNSKCTKSIQHNI